MSYDHVILTQEDHIATIAMNFPERLNAMNSRMMHELCDAVEVVKADSEIRVVILTGTGRAFCAGGDIKEMGEGIQRQQSGGQSFRMLGRAVNYRQGSTHRFCLALMSLEKPVIAAVNGPAVGGGCSIALFCDIRIASDAARFAEYYARRGLLDDEGGIYLLPQVVGMGWACELLFTADDIDAAQAERIGLVNRVVPHDQLMDEARRLATRIARMPPLAVQMSKRALYWKQRVPEFEQALHYYTSTADVLKLTEDHKEGVESFLEKREPNYKGR